VLLLPMLKLNSIYATLVNRWFPRWYWLVPFSTLLLVLAELQNFTFYEKGVISQIGFGLKLILGCLKFFIRMSTSNNQTNNGGGGTPPNQQHQQQHVENKKPQFTHPITGKAYASAATKLFDQKKLTASPQTFKSFQQIMIEQARLMSWL
jgi:hypothetical protein